MIASGGKELRKYFLLINFPSFKYAHCVDKTNRLSQGCLLC